MVGDEELVAQRTAPALGLIEGDALQVQAGVRGLDLRQGRHADGSSSAGWWAT